MKFAIACFTATLLASSSAFSASFETETYPIPTTELIIIVDTTGP